MRHLLSLISLSLLYSTASISAPLKVDGTRFRDPEGHHVILRGVNTSGAAKVPPFRAIRSAKDFAPVKAWGFNTLRLLFIWEAYQPEVDKINDDYLDYYVQMIRWAQEQNLYVIVDIHQDSYSRYANGGCGEGFPKWTIPPHINPQTPRNDASCKSWAAKAPFDRDMHQSWKHFYANTHGVRDHFLAMLQRLSKAVASEPNVIGFDLLNEPWGDEKTELYNLYKDAGAVVRAEMPDTILFLSGGALTATGLVPSHLPKIPGDNIVHAPHFYDPALALNTWTKFTLNLSNRSWRRMRDQWKSPIFLGEFGANPKTTAADGYVGNIYNLMDEELYSGTQWVYTPTWSEEAKDGWNHEDFSINHEKEETLRRNFAPRPWLEKASGEILKMQWDKKKGTLLVRTKSSETEPLVEVVVPDNFTWTGLDKPELMSACHENPEDRRLRCVMPAGTEAVELKFTFAETKK